MCCIGLKKLSAKSHNLAKDNTVKVSTPVIEFHPISEQERLFARKLFLVVSSNSNTDEQESSLSLNKEICNSIKFPNVSFHHDAATRYIGFSLYLILFH
jgi:hypothetical protein